MGKKRAPEPDAAFTAFFATHRHHRRRGREHDLLGRLPDRQRTAAVLRWAADLTEAEIARVMGVRRSTVSVTLTKARATLVRLLPAVASELITPGGPHE